MTNQPLFGLARARIRFVCGNIVRGSPFFEKDIKNAKNSVINSHEVKKI